MFSSVNNNALADFSWSDCNYILFNKLPWPGDCKGTSRFSSQAATSPPVYHTRWRLHTVPVIAERQAGKLWILNFAVFGLIRPEMEPGSTASEADALSTRPLNVFFFFGDFCFVMKYLVLGLPVGPGDPESFKSNSMICSTSFSPS